MEIGIPKETRRNESRVSLVPRDVAKLVEAGHNVYVEKKAGIASGFDSSEYEKAGARTSKAGDNCDLIIGVKAPALDVLKDGVTIMAYLHVEKGQNAKLLAKLKTKHILSYAFEEIRNRRGRRLINLGFEAGIVGAAEGLRILGTIFEKNGKHNPFKQLCPVREYGSRKAICSAISRLNTKNEINMVIMGKGCVSQGVQNLLSHSNIIPQVLWRNETINIEKYLPDVDLLINSVDWYPEEPRIVKKSALKLMKKTALIVDISCDTNGAVESCIPTAWEKPVYKTEGITHFCVSNLPSAIPNDSSINLSKMILPHVLKVANGEELDTGMMTRNGMFAYQMSDV